MNSQSHLVKALTALAILSWPGMLIWLWPLFKQITVAIRESLPPLSDRTWRILAIAAVLLFGLCLRFAVVTYFAPRNEVTPRPPQTFFVHEAYRVSIFTAVCVIIGRIGLGTLRQEDSYPALWFTLLAIAVLWFATAVLALWTGVFLFPPPEPVMVLLSMAAWKLVGPAPSVLLLILAVYPLRNTTPHGEMCD